MSLVTSRRAGRKRQTYSHLSSPPAQKNDFTGVYVLLMIYRCVLARCGFYYAWNKRKIIQFSVPKSCLAKFSYKPTNINCVRTVCQLWARWLIHQVKCRGWGLSYIYFWSSWSHMYTYIGTRYDWTVVLYLPNICQSFPIFSVIIRNLLIDSCIVLYGRSAHN